jgi:hypothetical protein
LNALEINYRVFGRIDGHRPGAHRAKGTGEGFLFRHLVPFLARPDPRRLDLRASLADPFGGLKVRIQEQPATLKIYVLLDLSGSMGFRGEFPKAVVMAEFIEAMATSVHKQGDSLGVYGAAERLLPEFSFEPTRLPETAHSLAGRLRRAVPRGVGCRGMLSAVRRLPSRACLVFLISDFHMPLSQVRELLTGLSAHWVIPVVIWDGGEKIPTPTGIARLVDAEDGGERLMLIRPGLRDRLTTHLNQRKERLGEVFLQQGYRPLILERGFSVPTVNRYFEGL